MVRKNYKWNISKEDGEKIVDDKINGILSDKGEMEISELNYFIQSRSRDITIENNKKKKNLNNFINNVFGGLRNFLEHRKTYKITTVGGGVMVDIKKEEEDEDIYSLNDYINDWIIVN